MISTEVAQMTGDDYGVTGRHLAPRGEKSPERKDNPKKSEPKDRD